MPEYNIKSHNDIYIIKYKQKSLGIIRVERSELECSNLLTGLTETIPLSDENFDVKLTELICCWRYIVEELYQELLTV